MYVGMAAEKTGDMRDGEGLLSRAVDGLREQGRLGMLAQALVHHAWVATHTGDWKEAMRDGTEAAKLARDTQQPQFGVTGQLWRLRLGLLGEDIEPLLAEPERELEAGAGPLLAPVHLARGAMAAGEGRHEDAFRHLRPVFDERRRPFIIYALVGRPGPGVTRQAIQRMIGRLRLGPVTTDQRADGATPGRTTGVTAAPEPREPDPISSRRPVRSGVASSEEVFGTFG